LAGELDIAVADDVRQRGLAALEQPGVRNLVLDLTDVTFLDSSAIGALVEIRNAAQPAGVPVGLRNASSSIRRTVEIMGLTDLFVLDPDGSRPTP
jgi:anti-anti-sigma factor